MLRFFEMQNYVYISIGFMNIKNGCLYVYKKTYDNTNIVKIGSTKNFIQRMNNYKTHEKDFDNKILKIWRFDIGESPYNCYKLDNIIRKSSQKYNVPYKYYDGSGGIEYYYFDTIEKLKKFLTALKVTYIFKEIDVDILREDIKNINGPLSKVFCESEDQIKIEINILDNDIQNNIDNEIINNCMEENMQNIEDNNIEEPIEESIESKLYPYQIPHLYQLYESMKINKCILDASDTGTGKTYIALALAKLLNLKPFIICPKSVVFNWTHVAKQLNIEIFGASNYESLKNMKYYTPEMEKVVCPYMDKNEKNFIFYLPNDIMVIFDEAHRCKNHKSITSQLLLSITKNNNKILLLSATITDKLECFKPFGVVFDLYEDVKNFNGWVRRQKAMYNIKYRNKKLDEEEMCLDIIHNTIFPNKGSRIRIKELGDLFPKNQVTANLYSCENADKIEKLYEIINEAVQDLKIKEKKAEALAKLTYARMKIEMFKVPIFIDLAEEALDNGYSVVIFTCFRDTMYHLADKLKTDCLIHGEQQLMDRQQCIDDFQSNKNRLIISMIQCGAVGLSLHDIHGNHPRISLLNPSWNGIEMKQALGRIHRAGSKSTALQRIIYCAETYEEKICELIDQKLKVIENINDGDFAGDCIDKEYLQEVIEYDETGEKIVEYNKNNKEKIKFEKIEDDKKKKIEDNKKKKIKKNKKN